MSGQVGTTGLAEARSADAVAQQAADMKALGFKQTPDGRWHSSAEEAASSSSPGAVTSTVTTAQAAGLVQVDERTPAQLPSLQALYKSMGRGPDGQPLATPAATVGVQDDKPLPSVEEIEKGAGWIQGDDGTLHDPTWKKGADGQYHEAGWSPPPPDPTTIGVQVYAIGYAGVGLVATILLTIAVLTRVGRRWGWVALLAGFAPVLVLAGLCGLVMGLLWPLTIVVLPAALLIYKRPTKKPASRSWEPLPQGL